MTANGSLISAKARALNSTPTVPSTTGCGRTTDATALYVCVLRVCRSCGHWALCVQCLHASDLAQGTYRFADGSRYEGEWHDGRRNGKGSLMYGSLYCGVVLCALTVLCFVLCCTAFYVSFVESL